MSLTIVRRSDSISLRKKQDFFLTFDRRSQSVLHSPIDEKHRSTSLTRARNYWWRASCWARFRSRPTSTSRVAAPHDAASRHSLEDTIGKHGRRTRDDQEKADKQRLREEPKHGAGGCHFFIALHQPPTSPHHTQTATRESTIEPSISIRREAEKNSRVRLSECE